MDETGVNSGEASQSIALSYGTNSIDIVVTAQDSTTQTYTIKACRTTMDLYKSGQTISYATGDDGDLEIGKSWPGTRFTDNEDNTITDNMTGLTWSKIDSPNLYDWDDAISLTLNSDWRIPNIHEMRTLFNYGYDGELSTYLNQIFDGAYNLYWTSTTAFTTSKAWGYGLGDGLSHVNLDLNKANDRAWVKKVKGTSTYIHKTNQTACYDNLGDAITCGEFPVKQDAEQNQGVELPSPRFTDNGNGTITDNLTGLMWQKAPDATLRNWATALTYANDSTLANFTDWRLPNVIELQTLTDASNSFPSVPTGHPFTGVQNVGYWSSTTNPDDTTKAFMVSIASGYNVLDESKTASAGTWIVR